MSAAVNELQIATMKQHCKALRVPTIANQFVPLAEQAIREKKTHVGYLEALLAAEVEDRERNTIERRIKEARLPRVKTLEEFDFSQSPHVTAAKMRDLADGGYIDRAEPVILIGDCGTGKTHLLSGLCVRRVDQQFGKQAYGRAETAVREGTITVRRRSPPGRRVWRRDRQIRADGEGATNGPNPRGADYPPHGDYSGANTKLPGFAAARIVHPGARSSRQPGPLTGRV
jgi:IstB-like ATP binding protein